MEADGRPVKERPITILLLNNRVAFCPLPPRRNRDNLWGMHGPEDSLRTLPAGKDDGPVVAVQLTPSSILGQSKRHGRLRVNTDQLYAAAVELFDPARLGL